MAAGIQKNPIMIFRGKKKLWHIRKDTWIEVIEYVERIMDAYVQNYANEKGELNQEGKTTFSRKDI